MKKTLKKKNKFLKICYAAIFAIFTVISTILVVSATTAIGTVTGVGTIIPEPPDGTAAEIAEKGINFFGIWIRRIGGIVALIGAIKFAIAISSEDNSPTIQALLIMVSGFMIVAAVTELDIFTATGGSGAEAEFQAIMDFISKWAAMVGGTIMFIGAINFGLGMREDDAGKKIIATKTFITGAIILSISQALNLFV